MAEDGVVILSLVEHGWQAARECSLALERHGVRVIHLVKGSLDHRVRQLITPHATIRMMDMPRALFWPAVYGALVRWRLGGRLCLVLVDNDRSCQRLQPWTRWMNLELLKVTQGSDGYELWENSTRVPLAAWEARWSRGGH